MVAIQDIPIHQEPDLHWAVAVYADGGVIGKNPSTIGGTWAFCAVNADGGRIRTHAGVLLPEDVGLPSVTNNVTELFAVLRAIWCLPEGWEGKVYSDSYVTLRRVFHDGKLNGVPDWMAEWTGKVRAKILHLNVRYTLLDGHPTREQLAAGSGKRGGPVSEHNVWCDAECGRQAREHLRRMREAVGGAVPRQHDRSA